MLEEQAYRYWAGHGADDWDPCFDRILLQWQAWNKGIVPSRNAALGYTGQNPHLIERAFPALDRAWRRARPSGP